MMQITRERINTINVPYTLELTILENVESIKYLGVTITKDLRWNTHMSNGAPSPQDALEKVQNRAARFVTGN